MRSKNFGEIICFGRKRLGRKNLGCKKGLVGHRQKQLGDTGQDISELQIAIRKLWGAKIFWEQKVEEKSWVHVPTSPDSYE